MLSLKESFLLGYLPASLGVYFSGVELYLALTDSASAPLQARLAQHFETLQARRPEVVNEVRIVEALLHKIALTPPPPPREPGEFPRWRAEILSAVNATLQTPAPKPATCHLTGYVLGDVWDTLNLGGMVYALLATEPAHPQLRAQATVLARAQERSLTKLDRALAYPIWEPAEQAALTAVRTSLAQMPTLDPAFSPETTPTDRAQAIVDGMRLLSERISELQQHLTA